MAEEIKGMSGNGNVCLCVCVGQGEFNLCSDPVETWEFLSLSLSHTQTHTHTKQKSSNPLFCPLKGKKKAMGFKGVIPRFLSFPIGKNSAFAP